MHPAITYELRVNFPKDPATAEKTKKHLIDWLLVHGVESFVEGTLEVDINQNQEEPPRDYYLELGGDLSPLSIYRYSRESLEDLSVKMAKDFGDILEVQVLQMDTSEWMEGWKDSFKPFSTKSFYVRPPWASAPVQNNLVELIIEPGMAFGTGQHATTRLCLELLGEVHATLSSIQTSQKPSSSHILDVGTGTGILAIAAKKLGYHNVAATDIEDDAIIAAKENGSLNRVHLDLTLGTFPDEIHSGTTYQLVFANILAVVLLRLMPNLKQITAPEGHLILSGILADEMAEIQERALQCDLLTRKILTSEGWSAVWLSRAK